jgi:hypothetical protein
MASTVLSPTGPLYHVVKNGLKLSPSGGRRVRVPPGATVEDLLRAIDAQMALGAPARVLYTEGGARVSALSDVPDGAVVVVSGGEPFQFAARRPARAAPARAAPGPPAPAPPPGCVEDHVRDALLASSAALDGALPREPLGRLLRATRLQLFAAQLAHAGLGRARGPPAVDAAAAERALAALEGVPAERLRVAVGGRRASGRSALLAAAAAVAYRKVLAAERAGAFLPFALDLRARALMLQDPPRFYDAVVRALFEALYYSRFELLPAWRALRDWFLCAAYVGALPPPPAPPGDALLRLGRECHARFHGRAGQLEQLEFVFALPARFAAAFGMAALYIVDHADCVGGEVARIIVAQLNRSLFLVAVNESLKLNAVVSIETENAVAVGCDWALGIGRTKVGIAQMGGCPAFVAAFIRICEELEEDRRRPIPPLLDPMFVPKAEIARKQRVEADVNAIILSVAEVMPDSVGKAIVQEVIKPGFELKLLS